MRTAKAIVVTLLGLGIFVFSYSYRMGIGSLKSPGPGLFPFLLGLLLFLLSFCKVVAIMKKSEGSEKRTKGPIFFGKLFLLLLSLMFYAIFLNVLGYSIATFVTLLFIFRIAGYKSLPKISLYSMIIVVLSYFLFTSLGVVFPRGILGRF
jgi:hypothetical protein